jgi:hypothetical protein
MLCGAALVGVSYAVAVERVSTAATDSHLAREEESQPSALELVQAGASDKREVRALAADMAAMKSELAALRDDKQTAQDNTERPAPAPKTAEQLQAEHDEYMAGVERAFEQEPRDERWAQGTAQSLRQALESEPVMVAAMRGIECRSRSCRLELRDDGSAAFAEEFPLMMHDMGALLSEVRFSHAELSDGARLHIMYMTQSSRAATDEL